jgi:Cu(I)/Ag(I) efflux system membrane fusion protein
MPSRRRAKRVSQEVKIMNKKRLILALVVIVLAGIGGTYLFQQRHIFFARKTSESAQTKATYQCPMHPHIVDDHPGVCPICNMALQKVEPAVKTAEKTVRFYRHPMRPDVTSPTPQKDEMGMDYIPVYEEPVGEAEKHPSVDAHANVVLSAEKQQLIGVTTEVVKKRRLVQDLRTVGTVAPDPDLYNAIVEYKEAKAAAARGELSDAIFRAAQLKLWQKGLDEGRIRAFFNTAQDVQTLIRPDKALWVMAQLYGDDAQKIRPGHAADVTSSLLPGRHVWGTVVAIDPVVNTDTRTIRARIRLSEAGVFHQQSFVNVSLKFDLGEVLAVPESAVIMTGQQRLVFVRQEAGKFTPVAVQLGRLANGYYEVLSGLNAGMNVVTAANFLIDSESRFRGAVK